MTKKCSIDGCGLKASVHGFCWGHDKQAKRGVPFHPVAQRKHRRNAQVPWLHAHASYEGDDCLIWPFAFHEDGRGQVTVDGHTKQAHRVMCELANGKPPSPRHEAAHSCGKGHLGCVNPRHLRWATSKENKADMLAHGTRLAGETHPHAVLSESRVLAIREFAHTCTQRAIADLFGLHPMHVGKIVRRQFWRHV